MDSSRHRQVHKEDSLNSLGKSVQQKVRNRGYRFEKNSFVRNAFKLSVPAEPV